MKMNSEVRQTVKELITGIAASTVCVAIISELIAWLAPDIEFDAALSVKLLLGALAGGCLAAFMAAHMATSLDKAMDMDEKSATNHIRKMYVIRTAIVLVIVVLLYYTGWVNLITMLFSLFGLKTAAYMQPLVHRIYCGPDPEPEPVTAEESEGE